MMEYLNEGTVEILRGEENPEHDVISLMKAVKEVKLKMR